MVRVVDCHAGVLDSNPGGPKIFSLWNCFTVDELSKKMCQRVSLSMSCLDSLSYAKSGYYCVAKCTSLVRARD